MTDITDLVKKMKSEAEKAADNFDPNMFVQTRDILVLTEALEKAQRYIEELREWNAGLAQESFERQQYISEFDPIRAAAEKLVRCKGRYHSEKNYRALAALFGVTTPDLPPLDSEYCTVTLKLPRPGFVTISGERTAVYLKDDVDAVLAAARINLEEK